MRRPLCAGTFRRLDFYAPRLLGARGKKTFFQKIFQKFFQKNVFSKKSSKKIFFSKKSFFFKKKIFFHKNKFFFLKKVFFPKKHFFLQKNVFLPKKFFFFHMTIFFQKLFPILWLKVLLWLKNVNVFEIVRIESAGKGMAIGKIRAVIGWKRIAERASFV